MKTKVSNKVLIAVFGHVNLNKTNCRRCLYTTSLGADPQNKIVSRPIRGIFSDMRYFMVIYEVKTSFAC